MNSTLASISLNIVGDNNDSTIITFLSLGATSAYLKIKNNFVLLLVYNRLVSLKNVSIFYL